MLPSKWSGISPSFEVASITGSCEDKQTGGLPSFPGYHTPTGTCARRCIIVFKFLGGGEGGGGEGGEFQCLPPPLLYETLKSVKVGQCDLVLSLSNLTPWQPSPWQKYTLHNQKCITQPMKTRRMVSTLASHMTLSFHQPHMRSTQSTICYRCQKRSCTPCHETRQMPSGDVISYD